MANRRGNRIWQAEWVIRVRVSGRGNGYKATDAKLGGEGKGEFPSALMGRSFYFNISNWILIH